MEKEKPNECEPEKADGKVKELLATEYNYNPRNLNELCNFVTALSGFTHGMQEKGYYSEILAKKVYEITLAINTLELDVEALRLRSEQLQAEVETAVLAKRKPEVSKSEADVLKKEVQAAEKQATLLHKQIHELLGQLATEYRKKNGL